MRTPHAKYGRRPATNIALHRIQSPDRRTSRTIKAWIGATHFRLRTPGKVRAEMSLDVLAFNLKRMIAIPR